MLNPHKIPWVGNYPSGNSDADTVWQSPSYQKDDPPTLHADDAFNRFMSQTYLFLDAREPDDYAQGHIRGSINLPFESIDQYWAKVEPLIPKDTTIVTYCSGTECEASLMLARLLRERGYKNVEIFFGGWQTWNKHRWPIEGKYDDEAAHK